MRHSLDNICGQYFGWFYYCIVPLGYGDMITLLIPKLFNLFEFTISTFFVFVPFPILSLTSPVIPFNPTPLLLYLPSSHHSLTTFLFFLFWCLPCIFCFFIIILSLFSIFYFYFILLITCDNGDVVSLSYTYVMGVVFIYFLWLAVIIIIWGCLFNLLHWGSIYRINDMK